MTRFMTLALISLFAIGGAAFAQDGKATDKKAEEGNPMVVMTTNMGKIEIELYAKEAPISVENFLRYVDEKFFDGTVFHRVIKGFMIQGGGFDAAMTKKETHDPIKNEEYYKLFAFFNQTPVTGGGGDPRTKPVLAVANNDQSTQLKQLGKQLDEANESLQRIEETLAVKQAEWETSELDRLAAEETSEADPTKQS